MDKQSLIELQKIDCNCNDCIYMVRDLEKFNKSVNLHYRWQLDYFNLMKSKADPTEAKKMRFEFDKSTNSINYGHCHVFNKDVSFIPNTCQLDTQKCFKHRRL